MLLGAIDVTPGGQRVQAQLFVNEQVRQGMALLRAEDEQAPWMNASVAGALNAASIMKSRSAA